MSVGLENVFKCKKKEDSSMLHKEKINIIIYEKQSQKSQNCIFIEAFVGRKIMFER